MTQVDSIIRRIQLTCKSRRIRLDDFMRTFDVLNNKKITPEQFARALDIAGIHLEAMEVHLLSAKYATVLEKITFIHYRTFCDEIELAFTQKGLERTPTANVEQAVTALQLNAPSVPLSELEQQELQVLMERLGHMAKVKGIVIKDIYQDFDRTKSGNVTVPQFNRNIYAAFDGISNSDVQLLLKVHNANGAVNYRGFHKALLEQERKGHKEKNVVCHSPLRHLEAYKVGTNVQPSSRIVAMDAESTLKRIVVQSRLRVKSFFTEYDPLRSGKCTTEQFKRGVKLCFGEALSPTELEALSQKYGSLGEFCISDAVEYAAFAIAVSPKTVQNAPSPLESFSQVEKTALNTVMSHLCNMCTTKRILIKPLFRDFDRRNRGTVSAEQFCRVLTMFDMMPQLVLQKDVLLRYYAKHNFIDFVLFCQDLERWNTAPATPLSGPAMNPPVMTSSTDAHRTAAVLMRYIKDRVRRERIRLEEYFCDYDTLRKGKISKMQLASGMSSAGFRLSGNEIETLSESYIYNDIIDATLLHSNLKMFAWTKFMEEVNSVFTIQGLEKEPTTDVDTAVHAAAFPHDQYSSSALSESERELILVVMQKIQSIISRKRLYIKPLFEDFDAMKRGYIPSSKFERALSIFQLRPDTQPKVDVLFKAFADKSGLSGKRQMHPDVNYKAFLDALTVMDSSSTVVPETAAFRKKQLHPIPTRKPTAPVSIATPTTSNQVDVEELLDSLREAIGKKRIRVQEFIAEGDKLRSGEISIPKFHTAINRLGIEMKADELHALTARFLSTKNADKVQWRPFISALESKPNVLSSSRPRPPLSNEVQAQVHTLMSKLSKHASQNRLHMKPYFQDYDKSHLNRVSQTQFAAVLDMMKLNLKRSELDLLNATFSVQSGHKMTKDMNYLHFVQMLEELSE